MRNYRKLSADGKLLALLAIDAKAKNITVSALVNEIMAKHYIKEGRMRDPARKASEHDIFRDITKDKRDN